MSFADKLGLNKALMNLLFKDAKKAMIENKISLGIFWIDDKGNFQVETFNEPMSIIRKEDLDKLKNQIK